jgi:hypothetical protein
VTPLRLTGLVLLPLVLALAACGGGSSQDPPAEGGPWSPADLVQAALASAPRSGDYRAPSRGVRSSAAAAVARLAAGRPAGIVPGFEVRSAGGSLTALVEQEGGPRRGWGVYVVRPGTSRRAIVEVPHPESDISTEDIGVSLFARASSALLLVAGAPRDAGEGDSSDVAHRTDTVFAAVDAAVVRRGDVVVQLHGFDAAHHGGYDVVLSDGEGTPSSLVQAAATRMRGSGFRTCVFDGSRCSSLGATSNVEGQHARQVGASFLHVELSERLRSDPGAVRAAVADLAALLAG